MRERAYKKYFNNDELSRLKPRDVSELKQQETVVSFVYIWTFLLTFVSFIALVALAIWFNKYTIFLSIVLATPTLLLFIISYLATKGYIKKITELKGTIKE
ncbi:hypothetical protein [Alkalibacillus salilacus]|uniref:Uncharacterized membrane protein (DUF485 family) n=1 Tax=Alkalibacillus salilacus TaxID=284582 RepID=A0ABT9VD07_9BACI|nr:hypothetical protein [Alkalibacillus salilacus]MDQ0158828.1 uncharacterized membrane protein (DUF485 family) [Alkalibacillus salilacus]